MNMLVKKYLHKLHSENYINPIQTRPKPEGGITKEKPKKVLPPGVRGPSGSEIDLYNDKDMGYDFRNFAQVDFDTDDDEGNKKTKNKRDGE